MASFKIDRSADSAQLVLNTKSSLLASINQINQMLAESLEMVAELEAQTQYGLPAELPFTAWKTTLANVQTALSDPAITDFTSQIV